MLSLEQLNALRGTKANAPDASVPTNNVSAATPDASSQSTAPLANETAQSQPQQGNKHIEPIEVPCKNYDDEDGHFAYIDAYTHQAMHVNLNSGQPYSQEDINRLSLLKVTGALSDEAKTLSWQQVLNNNTLYDQFGYPMFTVEEVENALSKMRTASDNQAQSAGGPKTDPFGFPL